MLDDKIQKQTKRLRLLIKIEASYAIISSFGLFFLIGIGERIKPDTSFILAVFFIIGLFCYYLIFWHNRQLKRIKKEEAFNLSVNKDAIKASWWLH